MSNFSVFHSLADPRPQFLVKSIPLIYYLIFPVDKFPVEIYVSTAI